VKQRFIWVLARLHPAIKDNWVEDIGRRVIIDGRHGNVPCRRNAKQHMDVLRVFVGKQAFDQRLEGAVPYTEGFDAAIDPLLAGQLGFAGDAAAVAVGTRLVGTVSDASCASEFTPVTADEGAFPWGCCSVVVWFPTALRGHGCCCYPRGAGSRMRWLRSDGSENGNGRAPSEMRMVLGRLAGDLKGGCFRLVRAFRSLRSDQIRSGQVRSGQSRSVRTGQEQRRGLGKSDPRGLPARHLVMVPRRLLRRATTELRSFAPPFFFVGCWTGSALGNDATNLPTWIG